MADKGDLLMSLAEFPKYGWLKTNIMDLYVHIMML